MIRILLGLFLHSFLQAPLPLTLLKLQNTVTKFFLFLTFHKPLHLFLLSFFCGRLMNASFGQIAKLSPFLFFLLNLLLIFPVHVLEQLPINILFFILNLKTLILKKLDLRVKFISVQKLASLKLCLLFLMLLLSQFILSL